jgi:hypothetical protein
MAHDPEVLAALAGLRDGLGMPSHEYFPALALAKRFHEVYERLAPLHGYTTRESTREFNPDSANGKLMVAVCREIMKDSPAHETKAWLR